MDQIEQLADLSIRRACGFAGLAVGSTMLALSFDLALAFRTGGVLTAAVLVGLLTSAARAPHRPAKRTEVWMMLKRDDWTPPPEMAARIGPVLRRRLLWHADWAATLSLGFGLFGLLLAALKRGV